MKTNICGIISPDADTRSVKSECPCYRKYQGDGLAKGIRACRISIHRALIGVRDRVLCCLRFSFSVPRCALPKASSSATRHGGLHTYLGQAVGVGELLPDARQRALVARKVVRQAGLGVLQVVLEIETKTKTKKHKTKQQKARRLCFAVEPG